MNIGRNIFMNVFMNVNIFMNVSCKMFTNVCTHKCGVKYKCTSLPGPSLGPLVLWGVHDKSKYNSDVFVGSLLMCLSQPGWRWDHSGYISFPWHNMFGVMSEQNISRAKSWLLLSFPGGFSFCYFPFLVQCKM